MKKIVVLLLTFILLFSFCNCSNNFDDLTVNHRIGNVTFLSSENWNTEIEEEDSLSFVLPNNDILFVGCSSLDMDITDYTEEQVHNLLDELITKPEVENVGKFITNHKEYVKVADCYGIFEDFEQIVGDVHNYNLVHTFIDDNAVEYSFAYQSVRPITEENKLIYEEVIKSIIVG